MVDRYEGYKTRPVDHLHRAEDLLHRVETEMETMKPDACDRLIALAQAHTAFASAQMMGSMRA